MEKLPSIIDLNNLDISVEIYFNAFSFFSYLLLLLYDSIFILCYYILLNNKISYML